MSFVADKMENEVIHIARSEKYTEILEHSGFCTDVSDYGRVFAHGNYEYRSYDKSGFPCKYISFGLIAWGNCGLTFHKRIGVQIPCDIVPHLPEDYINKIIWRDGKFFPPTYFLKDDTKEKMSEDLEALILEIAQAKYKAEHGCLKFWQKSPRLRFWGGFSAPKG